MTQGNVHDARGRALTDLRLSVTDKCNFRCRYCLPRETTGPHSFLPKADLLSFEELEILARVFVEQGVRKIRLTGGEPLLRRDLPKLVQSLRALGVELALTTNGVLLPEYAGALRSAGLDRVTVSLDALDPAVFAAMCDAPSFGPSDVLRGIDSAVQAGFRGVKINCVVKRSANLSEVVPLVRHFKGSGHELRFIEYMDVGTLNAWQRDQVVPSAELKALLLAEGELRPVPRVTVNDVAQVCELPGLRVGFISSVTEPFCGNCTRARVTANGRFYTCLFGSEGVDLRQILRGDAPPAETLRTALRSAWSSRRDRYSEERVSSAGRRLPLVPSARVEMARIGG